MHKPFGILEERESEYNGRIMIVGSLEGPRIVVGGVSQSGPLMKSVWNVAIKKLKEQKHNAREVLILGLGGGSVAEVLAKHFPEAHITGLDIDGQMIDVGKKYLGLNAIKNIDFVVADAERWVAKKHHKKYDLILIDLFRGTEIPSIFYDETFIVNARKLLRAGGVIAFNHLFSEIEKKDATRLLHTLRKLFPVVVSVRPEANIIFLCQTPSK